MASTGSMSKARERMENTLADTSAFQSFCGVSTSALAREHIYHGGVPRPLRGSTYTVDEARILLPLAIITTLDIESFHQGTGTRHEATQEGNIDAYFEWPVPPELLPDTQAIYEAFENSFGPVIDELWTLAGAHNGPSPVGYLAITGIRVPEGPMLGQFGDAHETGDLVSIHLEIEWQGGAQ